MFLRTNTEHFLAHSINGMVCGSVYSAVGTKFQNGSDKCFVRKLRKLPDVTYYRKTTGKILEERWKTKLSEHSL
jgi:hypothetical protein